MNVRVTTCTRRCYFISKTIVILVLKFLHDTDPSLSIPKNFEILKTAASY